MTAPAEDPSIGTDQTRASTDAYVGLGLSLASLPALLLPGGWTLVGLVLAIAAVTIGIVSVRGSRASWQAIVAIVIGSGVGLLLLSIVGRVIWLNFAY